MDPYITRRCLHISLLSIKQTLSVLVNMLVIRNVKSKNLSQFFHFLPPLISVLLQTNILAVMKQESAIQNCSPLCLSGFSS